MASDAANACQGGIDGQTRSLSAPNGARTWDGEWAHYWLVCFCFASGMLVGAIWASAASLSWQNWTANDVTAAATVALAVVTVGLLLMAWYQLTKQTFTQRQWATLQACDRYDSDEILLAARTVIRELETNGKTAKGYIELNQCCRTVFNYFDSISIGLSQGLYVEEIVVEHLGSIMGDWRNTIRKIDNATIEEFAKALPTHFVRFEELVLRWAKKYPDIVPRQD